VHLHAEVALAALLGLVHLLITLAAFILGGARNRNNAGIDYTAFPILLGHPPYQR